MGAIKISGSKIMMRIIMFLLLFIFPHQAQACVCVADDAYMKKRIEDSFFVGIVKIESIRAATQDEINSFERNPGGAPLGITHLARIIPLKPYKSNFYEPMNVFLATSSCSHRPAPGLKIFEIIVLQEQSNFIAAGACDYYTLEKMRKELTKSTFPETAEYTNIKNECVTNGGEWMVDFEGGKCSFNSIEDSGEIRLNK